MYIYIYITEIDLFLSSIRTSLNTLYDIVDFLSLSLFFLLCIQHLCFMFCR